MVSFNRKNALSRYEKERRRNLLAEPGPHDLIVVLDHLKAGFNIPKIFRSGEAFGVREIHLVGILPFDPAPAKGSFRKVPARFHDDFSTCLDDLHSRGYSVFVLEPVGEQDLCDMPLPLKTAIVLGHEEFGLSFDRSRFPEVQSLSIPQFGTVQSLNVSVAASIVMFEYIRQHSGSRGRSGP